MSIYTQCSACGETLSAPDSAAGRNATCPECGNVVLIPEAVHLEEFADSSSRDQEYGSSGRQTADRRPCPMCGEIIVANAVKCRYCGEVLNFNLGGGRDFRVEQAAKELLREKHDRDTALQLLITGIIGCFSPILAIYGIVFLLKRSYDFPRKGLAIAGTLLHCIWTIILILYFASGGIR